MSCILVIDDHALVREGLAQTLSRLGGALSVIEATGAAHALTLIDERDDIDLVITDLIMPGMNGFSLLATLRERDPSLPVLVVSALCDRPTVSRAMRQGASGFVSKGDSGAQLVAAVREVLDGNLYTPPARTKVVDAPATNGLTRAQQRVLLLLAEGCSNREIAESLGLAEGTVKVHVSRILSAYKVGSRSQLLIALAREQTRRRSH
ncbi:response regulator transcription factor [Methyloversatilis sp.]|uniref:response regulator transcription factor n=1 Tax=Methyloversatilis sp. TaxID=2569862 RepID=UPI002732978D|nr:response regulator transcription factor [Methyloversatilis sp.]MDP2870144.1 response regulator transcription factor [Methyloversatilis sp.]MDP3454488.1 response regulator transcription factor [Methyloversatilis sp.]MDP3578947.1 response regulator transcription factor [Methyloversatilis sp.]